VLGASFLLASDQLSELRECADDDAREDWLMALEEDVADDRWLQFDKAWDPLHRARGESCSSNTARRERTLCSDLSR
jgi:hypothetical protein